MRTALIVVDVQNDFCEGGSLAVAGGSDVAGKVYRHLTDGDRYDLVVATRDWHLPRGTNGGHFADAPDYGDTWPRHCVQGSYGADFHHDVATLIRMGLIGAIVSKGAGAPAYSGFEGTDSRGANLDALLQRGQITQVDVVGIATDYCVKATALDARHHGYRVRVLTDMTAAVSPEGGRATLAELTAAGCEIVEGESNG